MPLARASSAGATTCGSSEVPEGMLKADASPSPSASAHTAGSDGSPRNTSALSIVSRMAFANLLSISTDFGE